MIFVGFRASGSQPEEESKLTTLTLLQSCGDPAYKFGHR